MTDYKNLTDSVLLAILDDLEPNQKEFKEIKQLAKDDPEFRSKIVELKVKNKQSLEDNLLSIKKLIEQVDAKEVKDDPEFS